MKTRIYLFFALISFSFITNETVKEVEVELTSESFLYIKGTSNINTFTCVYDAATLARKVPVQFIEKGNTLHFKNVALHLENKGFNCGNKGINNDFHDLLQTKKYPDIHFELLQITKNQEAVDASVAITIANIKKHYTFPVQTSDGGSSIEGVLCLNITDFDLTPPKKMMGMIVVREDIEIVFNFDVEIQD